MQSTTFKRSLVALGVAGALGLGALAADRIVPVTTAAAPASAPSAPVSARSLPGFADLVAQQGPAVVQIMAVKSGAKTAMRGTPDIDPDELPPFFRNFPFRGMPGQGTPQPGPQRGMGSGFIVSAEGIVLTNAHVVADADEVKVKLTDEREFDAKVLGSDAVTDVAVLKIEAKNLPVVKLGDPSKARVGDWVVAIGTPYGLDNTVTSGIISAKSRALPGDSIVPFIQTDAAVNPGNSGGPLFNLDGEVIGINSQIFSRTGGFQGLAFAIPIDVALKVKDEIQQTGHVSHGRLGVTVQPLDQSLAENFGLKSPQGALVGSVQKDGPAAKAGLQAGDVILKYDGKPITRSSDLPALVAATKPGEKATLEVWRDGKSQTITAAIGTRDGDKVADAGKPGMPQGKLGVAVRPLTPEERKESKLAGGLVVEQVGGAAAKAGVQQGDVILQVNRTPVKSVEELRELVNKSSGTLALLIQRDDAQVFVPVRIG
jgi:serine protease Do